MVGKKEMKRILDEEGRVMDCPKGEDVWFGDMCKADALKASWFAEGGASGPRSIIMTTPLILMLYYVL